jgi:cytochrome c5
MSDSHPHAHPEEGSHEGPIKTPKQLVLTVVASFVVPIIVIVLLVNYVAFNAKPGAGSDGMTPQTVAQRIQRIGAVELRDASNPALLRTGEQVYQAQCVACHGAGLAGAPKLGDAAAWAPRITTGYEALLTSSLKGKGAMGAQGGGDYTDFEIGRAVVYMANQAGGKLAEPKAPAVPDAASAPFSAPAAAVPVPAVAPVAATTAAAVVAAAPAVATPALYTNMCAACHIAGLAGAPKSGDKAAWAPRIALGVDALTASVIKGKGAMPPRGGSQATDAEIRTVVEYMVKLNSN